MRPDLLTLLAGDVAGAARSVRDLADHELEEIPPRFLEAAARLLRAGAYSATTAARRLERRAFRPDANARRCPCVICTRRRAEIEPSPEREETL